MTTAAEAGAVVAAIDPTLLAILSIFGGAALTAAAGFWGAWRGAKREHERWVRERRYEAYLDFNRTARTISRQVTVLDRSQAELNRCEAEVARLLSELSPASDDATVARVTAQTEALKRRTRGNAKRIDAAADVLSELRARQVDRLESIHLLGPAEVSQAARALNKVMTGQGAARAEAFRAMEQAMRKTLLIKDYNPRGRRGRPPA